MPPACRTPGFLGENGRADGNEVYDVDALRMQLVVSNVKGTGKDGSSRGSSSLSYEGPDIDEDPTTFSEKESPKVLTVLATVLDRLVARNEQFANTQSQQGALNHKKLTLFHGLRAPSISIAKYLERIYKYTSCSPSCFVVGYVFIDRLIHRQPDLLVTSLNVHRLLVTSVMVATKMLDDVHFNNAFFARVGGVSVVELNRLELEFLFRLDFKLSVTISVFESYCSYLEKEVSVLEKKPERVERSLPPFGSVPVTPYGSSPPTPGEMSPRFRKRPPGIPSHANRKLNSYLFQQPTPNYMARNSPPSR